MRTRFVLVGLLALLLWPSHGWGARLLTTGFEENDIVPGGTIWSAATGTAPSVVTTSPHSGTYRLDTASSVTTSGRRWQNSTSSAGSGTWFVRAYWRTTDETPEGDMNLIALVSSGGVEQSTLALKTTGVLRILNSTTATVANMTYVVSPNTWYRLELRHLISNTVGEIEARIYADASDALLDSVSITGEDTLNPGLGQVTFGTASASSITGVHSFDDLAVNDDTGSFQTSWPGQGKIAYLEPSADTAVAWTKAGSAPAGTNFGGVSELPGAPDDGTTYNQDSGSTNEDKMALTDTPAEVTSNATMKVLDLYGKVSASASSGTMALKVWDEGGTGTEGPTMTVNSTTWRILTGAEHQPYDISTKTKANLDSFSGGYIAKSGAVEKRVSALWANVEWIEAPASGDRSIMLLGVGR